MTHASNRRHPDADPLTPACGSTEANPIIATTWPFVDCRDCQALARKDIREDLWPDRFPRG